MKYRIMRRAFWDDNANKADYGVQYHRWWHGWIWERTAANPRTPCSYMVPREFDCATEARDWIIGNYGTTAQIVSEEWKAL